LTVPQDESDPAPIGLMIDPGDGSEPFGEGPGVDRMLVSGGDDRRAKFDYYYAGWSNGYVQTQAQQAA